MDELTKLQAEAYKAVRGMEYYKRVLIELEKKISELEKCQSNTTNSTESGTE